MVAKLLLPLLSVFVVYTIFYYADINNARALADKAVESQILPGTMEPLRTVYTGVPQIDKLLSILTTFFWPATDGSHPALTLHSLGFSGTFGSAWILVTLEAWRRGNARTIVALPMAFGLAAQVLTFAFATPLFLCLHLSFSVTARKPNAENIRVPRAVLNAIPLVFTVGFAVPSALLILPRSEQITTDLKQIFIALWQPWPAYTSILLVLANLVFSPFVSNDRNIDPGRATQRALRRVYAYAFGNAAVTHLISWIVSLSTVVAPSIFKSEYVSSLHPFEVFDIPQPWASPVAQVSTLGEGVHAFLRWDYLIGSAGVLIWAVSVYKSAHRVVYGRVGCLGLVTKVILLSLVAGPTGAAVELLWERDELIMNEMGGIKRVAPKNKKSS